MKPIASGALLAAILLFASSHAHADATLSPGKVSAFTTTAGVNVPDAFTTVASVQLEKGKKKHVVMVDASIIESTNIAQAIGINATINGFAMEPGVFQVTEACSNAISHCSVQGQYWADLDALELVSPGSFVGQPLQIDVSAAKLPTGLANVVAGTASIRALLVKK